MINKFNTGRHYHPTKPQIIEWFVRDGNTYFNDEVRNITGKIELEWGSDKEVLWHYDRRNGYTDISTQEWEIAKPDCQMTSEQIETLNSSSFIQKLES